MNQQSLAELRERILADITPLVINTTDDGEDRFNMLLRIIQAGGAPREIYDRAYAAASGIDDTDGKLNALMSLLDEVDITLSEPADTGPAVADAAPAPVPEESHYEQQPEHNE